jgi:hypothetical protein
VNGELKRLRYDRERNHTIGFMGNGDVDDCPWVEQGGGGTEKSRCEIAFWLCQYFDVREVRGIGVSSERLKNSFLGSKSTRKMRKRILSLQRLCAFGLSKRSPEKCIIP